MRVAVVHEWLDTYAGSEQVLEQILAIYPKADLYVVADFLPANKRSFLAGRNVKSSFVQKLPMAKSLFRLYLPLMPMAVEQFNLSEYNVVISNSHAVAKGVITGPGQLHISYVHSPMRYAWDLQHEYLHKSKLDRMTISSLLVRWILHRMRIWDTRTANGVDYFVANSNFIAHRIWKTYRREAKVIYPPVAVTDYVFGKGNNKNNKEEYFITVSRNVPYKRLDLIVKAFNSMPDKKLVIIGDGVRCKELRKLACSNVSLFSWLERDLVCTYLQNAKAFVFAAVEDFGISVLEAQAYGVPVIAYGRGGVLETIKNYDEVSPKQATGLLYFKQDKKSLIEAVNRFEDIKDKFTKSACRKNAQNFSAQKFRHSFTQFVQQCCDNSRIVEQAYG